MSVKNDFTFSCKLSNLQKVRNYMRDQLSELNLTEIQKNQIVLAVDEVCSNLIIHSNKNDESQSIKLNLSILKTPKGISIELKENGIPFDYLQYNETNIDDLIRKEASGKMGLMLVRRIMDEIQYVRQDNYNICRLYKSLA